MSKIKNMAKQIAKAENEISLGKNVKENEDKILYIMSGLTIEEMFKLDIELQRILK